MARVLWEEQSRLREDVDPGQPALALETASRPGGPIDDVVRALGSQAFTPADLWRALRVFHAEATGKRDAGDPAPLRWLDGRQNWRLDAIDRALAQTPETARARALGGDSRKAGGRGRDPTRTGLYVEDLFAVADALDRQADEQDRRKAEAGAGGESAGLSRAGGERCEGRQGW